jgi:hypothetical protein
MVRLTVESAGPPDASTDPDTGYRTYSWNGVDYPSVTTIKSMAGLSYPIHRWALNCVADRAIEQIGNLNTLLIPGDDAAKKAAHDWLIEASTDEKDRAADLGTRIHDAAAKGTDIARVAPDMQPQLRQYYNWLEASGFEVLLKERSIFNLSLGYAGTFDLLGRTKDGDLFLVDIKTGKSIFPEHALQLLAYSMGEFVGTNNVVDEEATALLRGVNGLAVLHLQKTQAKWLEVDYNAEMYAAYTGLLTFGVWSHAHKSLKSVVRDTKVYKNG